ncbi:hypothetical protein [Mycobacterium avium]|uniref:hypothetical protein n=1 Tax=Mycobacterium avium TaxID=1764 RepID=UPI000BB006F8|nr:hypothetical protein [Mycobacterium avium]PBA42260.1 hypothetical protein CKJ63_07400 [Mycobacterium avium]PBA86028.1 hypothetical protein CKJ72_00165 [Mycobacterium avium]
MPAQSIKVVPPALLSAADAVAVASQDAAAPVPGAVFTPALGSPADGVLAAFAAGIATQTAEMSAEVGGKGPEVVAKTSAGVGQLESVDADNAAAIQAVGESAVEQAAQPGGIIAV